MITETNAQTKRAEWLQEQLDAERKRRVAAEAYIEVLNHFAETVGIGPARDEMVRAAACDDARAAWLATVPK